MSEDRQLPLEGIRVLEVGELIAGPFACTLLGEFGADVIKIERPQRGDLLRLFGPQTDGEFVYWSMLARNKKSVAVDLSSTAGRVILGDLIKRSDILMDSLRPGVFDAWGFDDETLQSMNPRLITLHTSGFGRTGPYSSLPGYDPVAQAISGLSYMTGDPSGPPMRAGGSIPVCDFTSSFLGALGVCLAIIERYSSEQGQVIDVALYDLAFRVLAPLLTLYDRSGEVYGRHGNRSLGGAPTGHFRTRDDRWLAISIQGDEQFVRCAQAIGREDWIENPDYRTIDARTVHREVIDGVMVDWVAVRTAEEVVDTLAANGLVCGVILTPADAAQDPHLNSRSLRRSGADGSLLPWPVPMLSRTPGQSEGRAPDLGEQTAEVLTQVLGYTDDRVESLRSAGIIEML